MRFEDMDVWKVAAKLSVSVYQELASSKEYGFKDQIARAGLSIPSNIAEAFGRSTDRDKRNFLNYAKGSCAEFRSQTYIGMKAGLIDHDVGRAWINDSNRTSAMLTSLWVAKWGRCLYSGNHQDSQTKDQRPKTNDK